MEGFRWSLSSLALALSSSLFRPRSFALALSLLCGFVSQPIPLPRNSRSSNPT